MPNPIKYTTGTETLALKKGNFYIGTGDVGKGPSDVTGFYQGLSPSEGGYVIYMNREGAPGDLSYHVAANDSELISFTNNLAGQSYTTVQECLVYYAGQSDKVVLNRDYEGIVTDGLVLNVDAGFTPSYPKSGTTWTDLSLSGNNGTLTNGPTFNTDGGGSIVFDGVDDYVTLGTGTLPITSITACVWVKTTTTEQKTILGRWGYSNFPNQRTWYIGTYTSEGNLQVILSNNGTTSFNRYVGPAINDNTWKHLSFTFNAGTVILYIDGISVEYTQIGSYTVNSLHNSTSPLLVGAADNGIGNNFNGNVSTSQIYNRALSADEILQNYNAQKGRFGL
jgi:hypothetical protein